MLYGIGAAIVILGALFKIQHWPGGNLLLTIGMITEAIVFTFSAFEKSDDNKKNKEFIGEPYFHKSTSDHHKDYVNEIKKATKNVSLINKYYKEQLKLTIASKQSYEKINTEAKSLANNTYFISKTYNSILKAMKS